MIKGEPNFKEVKPDIKISKENISTDFGKEKKIYNFITLIKKKH